MNLHYFKPLNVSYIIVTVATKLTQWLILLPSLLFHFLKTVLSQELFLYYSVEIMNLGRVVNLDEGNNTDNSTICNAFAKYKVLC